MPNVPHQPIVRRIEAVMQRNGKLNHAEIRRQMATSFRYRIEHKGAQFFANVFEFFWRVFAQLVWEMNRFQ